MDKKIWQFPKQEKSLDEAQTPLWFWNDKLEKNEIERQLRMQTEIGVTCTNPHARTNGGEGYIGGYLDEEWFENIKTVVKYKKENEEKMWLYDEIDWPAGTCNQTLTLDENNREKYISIERIELPAKQTFRAQLKTFEGKGLFGVTERTDKSHFTYNIHIIDAATKKPYAVESFFIYDMFGPELEFSSESDSIVFITKVCVDTYEGGGNLQVNYLSSKATQKFLESTYDKYYEKVGEEFGKVITCVFNDETRMCHSIAWCDEFPEEFLKQKGYDIRTCIYQLIESGEEAGRVRCDYFDVLAYLYQNNYFGVIHSWCKKHGLKLFAHLLGEETLYGHARYSGDYLRQNRFMDVCGADHLGKGIGSLNIKFTACGAHSYGKKRSAVEVFAGCGWDMTFEEYIRMVTWMYQQGMQIIINHGFFYSDRGKRKNDWPPSQFFQWQGWKYQSQGNDMIRRLHYAMTDGINETDILVYYPIETFWLHYIPNQHFTHGFFHGAFLESKQAEEIDKEVQLLLNGLLSKNLDFDILHNDAAENFEVKDGKLINKLTGQVFSVLILSMCEVLPKKILELLIQFVEQGGKVIVQEKLPYLGMKKEEDAIVKSTISELYKQGKIEFIDKNNKDILYSEIKKYIPTPIEIVKGTNEVVNNHPCYPNYLIDPYLHGGEDLKGVMYTRYIKNGKRNTLFMNYSDHAEIIEVMVESKENDLELWDTFTGEIKKAKLIETSRNKHRIEIQLPCNYGILLVSNL